MIRDEVVTVEPSQWVERAASSRDEGFTWFDSLGCVDEIGRADEFRLVLRLVNREQTAGRQLHVRVPRDEAHLASLTAVFAGADFHEREVHDFFGVVFDGGDPSPLLNHSAGIRPLRKDFVLAARAAQPWPGAKEPGASATASRRRMAPAGVPDPSVWGDRDAAEPAPTPEQLAAAVAGGRVRRR